MAEEEMTKEEILKMGAGREMDALVGEQIYKQKIEWMDCQRNPECGDLEAYTWTKHSKAYPIEKHPCYFIGGTLWETIPFFSTDISAAWEVVEKLEHNWNLLREVGMCGTTPTEGSMQYRFILAYPNLEMVGVTATTAPLAICRAALIAVMEDPNGKIQKTKTQDNSS
jgi:hypothetical protein